MTGTRILRENRDYRHYWLAMIVSNLGSTFSTLAFPLLVLSMGGSAVQATAVGTVAMVTRVGLRMVGGDLADRFDRRWLMLAGDLIRVLVLASVPVAYGLGVLGYPQILAAAVAEGTASALLFNSVATIAVRDVVPKEQLVDASSRSSAASGVVTLAGPALGGALFEIGRMLPFELDAASYLFSALMLITMATRPVARDQAMRDRRWSAGIRWLRGQPVLLRCLAAGTVLNITGAALSVSLVVAMARTGVPGSTIGAVVACGGVGAIVGSLLAPRFGRRLRTTVWIVLNGMVWTVGLLCLAFSLSPWMVAPDMVVLVGITPLGNIGLSAQITAGTPREVLGRVIAAIGTVTGSLACFGPLIGGALLESVGVSATWLVLSGGTFIVTVTMALPLVRVESLVQFDAQDSAAEPTGLPADPSVARGQAPDEAPKQPAPATSTVTAGVSRL